jgi:hypothetical protein
MIRMMLSEVASNYGVLPPEYLVYAIYDPSGRCCYVGMTRVARKRIHQHLAHMTNVKTILGDGDDLPVEFYAKADIDAMFAADVPAGGMPHFDDDRKWAEAAEWFLCDTLHPYLNVKKGWPGELARTKSFARQHGIDLSSLAETTLRTWNPPFNHAAIIDAYVNGANSSALAQLAGINITL